MPRRIGEHLDLDVSRPLHVALDEDPAIAEARDRLVRRPPEPLPDFALVGRDPHPLAAAAGRGLEHHGVADVARHGHRLLRIGEGPVHARDGADAGFGSEPAGLDLVAHGPDCGRRRSDEGDSRPREGGHELRVLGEEAETRVHRVRAGRARRLHHRLDFEVALGRRGGTHAHRDVRHADVGRTLVRLGVDRGRGDPHAAGGPCDAAGDLAPVRDEDAIEAHGLALGPPAPSEAAPRTGATRSNPPRVSPTRGAPCRQAPRSPRSRIRPARLTRP